MYNFVALFFSIQLYSVLYCLDYHQFTEEERIKLKLIVVECNVPIGCREQIISDLENRYQLSACNELNNDNYNIFGRCLDSKFHKYFNVPRKYLFIHGEVCCENIPNVSDVCQKACRNVFYAISMNQSFKEQQLKMLCNTINFSGDEKILKCTKYIQKIK
uniref:DUF19 domain-containing protein n=1 Tax=Strongyloides stercoralis TaxID=6248 RepID=A0A0K0DVM5_STRER